jgi:plasmid stabilization system protein ParE
VRDVYLSKRAANKLEKLLEFLASEWSIKVKRAFIVKLETALPKFQGILKAQQNQI